MVGQVATNGSKPVTDAIEGNYAALAMIDLQLFRDVGDLVVPHAGPLNMQGNF